jgi:SAM-dependent methyltransferase
MEEISKAWDWSRNNKDFWNDPSEESYFLVDRWKKKGYSRFLDLGCGLGRHSIFFANNGYQVDSFDLSDNAIDGLKIKSGSLGLGNIACRRGDMNELPYADGAFDCLLAYHVISHTDSRGIKKVIREIDRVLRAGGEFFITLCSKKSWSFQEAGYPRHDENTIIKIEDGPENGVPHYYSDENAIAELFRGIQLITIRHVQDLVLNATALKNSWHYFILGGKG